MSDSGGRVATPLQVLQRSGDRRRDHRALIDLALEWEVDCLVVGLPLSLDGGVGPAARAVLDEVAELRELSTTPVETYDERLSTVTAERSLAEQGVRGANRRRVVDQVAAAVVLQAWLDRRQADGRVADDPARHEPDGDDHP